MKKLTILASLLLMSTQALGAANCNTSIPASTPDADFTDNNDGTVTHGKTGLTWQQCSDGLSGSGCATGTIATYTWQQALQRVETINSAGFAGFNDWRLPNIAELASIIEDQCTAPAVNGAIFPATASNGYWSATPFADSVTTPNLVWVGDFMGGQNVVLSKTDTPYHIRLVRGQ